MLKRFNRTVKNILKYITLKYKIYEIYKFIKYVKYKTLFFSEYII